VSSREGGTVQDLRLSTLPFMDSTKSNSSCCAVAACFRSLQLKTSRSDTYAHTSKTQSLFAGNIDAVKKSYQLELHHETVSSVDRQSGLQQQ